MQYIIERFLAATEETYPNILNLTLSLVKNETISWRKKLAKGNDKY